MMRFKYTLSLIGAGMLNMGVEHAEPANLSYVIPEPVVKTEVPVKAPVEPTVVDAMAVRYDVVYNMSDGSKITRRGGTRAWRNANPGNLRYSDFAKRMGAVGKAGGFAVFPNEEVGAAALDSLLRTDKYNNLTIANAITKYAPPHENDTHGYIRTVEKATGLKASTQMHTLDSLQRNKIIKIIRRVEGWEEGIELRSDTGALFANAQTAKIAHANQRTM